MVTYKEYFFALAFCLWPCLAVALHNPNISILDPVHLNKTGFQKKNTLTHDSTLLHNNSAMASKHF